MSETVNKPPWHTLQWTSNKSYFLNEKWEGMEKGEWKEDADDAVFALKERIQPFDRTELWDLAKRITNPYERIHSISSRLSLPRSICLLMPLSRSFFKMIEILHVMNFFERNKKTVKLKSLHLCEGPGGFIEAFLYKAAEYHRQVNVSYAMTLRSTHQMIPGWRRATPFLQKHPNVKLIYGATGTGDIYEELNQEYIYNLCKNQNIKLVTADGGFDFSDDFQAQEKMIFLLLLCSSIIALKSLSQDGDFVLKVFDIQSQLTRDFLTILGSCFNSWTLYKPVTSRPCNSEWYFLGRSAVHNRQNVISLFENLYRIFKNGECLTRILSDNSKNEFLLGIQKDRIIKQSSSLEQVLLYCENPKREEMNKTLWDSQIQPSKFWCEYFKIPSSRCQN
jgi:23S rRNA U2552 (ribose-2'-O)-methylase RlmE/FtsJ